MHGSFKFIILKENIQTWVMTQKSIFLRNHRNKHEHNIIKIRHKLRQYLGVIRYTFMSH